MKYGIIYSHDTDYILVGHCDVDWASSAYDKNGTSCGFFFLGNNLFSCFSKKQNCVSLSTIEVEYIVACSICNQLWMKQMLKEYNGEQDVMTLYCDNFEKLMGSLGTCLCDNL
jgi:hypothetical protein